MKIKPEFVEEQRGWTRKNVLKILREGVEKDLFCIDNLERDVEVFLYSIGYFFPFATTKQYYQIEEKDLAMVIDWFIEKWSC